LEFGDLFLFGVILLVLVLAPLFESGFSGFRGFFKSGALVEMARATALASFFYFVSI
jgi:hypothetical protein